MFLVNIIINTQEIKVINILNIIVIIYIQSLRNIMLGINILHMIILVAVLQFILM